MSVSRLALLLVASTPSLALAGNGPNIALVDLARVFEQHEGFKARMTELRNEVQSVSRQAATMKSMVDGVEKAMKDAKTQEERIRHERDLLRMRGEFQTLQATKQKEFLHAEAVLYRETYVDVQRAITEYAREQGFGMVFRFDSKEVDENDDSKAVLQKLNRLVVFTEPEHDITDAVIARVNGKR